MTEVYVLAGMSFVTIGFIRVLALSGLFPYVPILGDE